MTDETEKTPARVESVIKSMIEARVARERAEAELAEKKAQEKSLRDRMALLEAALQPRSITAWCADATEDAEGTVGTIEVNGEFGAQDSILVVAPQEVLPTLQAGAVVAREVQAGHQAFFTEEAITTICQTTIESVSEFAAGLPLSNEIKAG